MAQLIKLRDYISRYELHLTHYTNQFLRLKQLRWQECLEEAGYLQADNQQVKPLREQFLEDVFQFQLRWASATLLHESLLDEKYRKNETLKLLLKTFPDNYLLLFEPIAKIENAVIELGQIMIAPTNIYCLFFPDGEKSDIYQAENDHFWQRLRGNEKQKIVSPLLSLRRTTNIVRRMLASVDFRVPVKEAIVVPDGYIENLYLESGKVECVDVRNYHDWHLKMINNPSPIKYQQLKTAELFLRHCETESYRRYHDDGMHMIGMGNADTAMVDSFDMNHSNYDKFPG